MLSNDLTCRSAAPSHPDERAVAAPLDVLRGTARWVVGRAREHPVDLAPNLFTVGGLLASDKPPRPADH